jgi:protein-tyrosine phosphatase
MRGFVDLHSHWIANIDDGCRSPEAGVALLKGLHAAGFDVVVATPHMRPGMFDNDRSALLAAFDAMKPHLAEPGLPEVHLSSEHFLNDVVFDRLRSGQALPYPRLAPAPAGAGHTLAPARAGDTLAPARAGDGGRAALVEFPPEAFPLRIEARFSDLRRHKLTPVLAHPERYRPVWNDDACLDPLLDTGAHLLLDIGAIVGRYGRAAQRAAEKLLDEDAYEAACSDAHKPEDAEWVVRAIERLENLAGKDEARRLLVDGPRRILNGDST